MRTARTRPKWLSRASASAPHLLLPSEVLPVGAAMREAGGKWTRKRIRRFVSARRIRLATGTVSHVNAQEAAFLLALSKRAVADLLDRGVLDGETEGAGPGDVQTFWKWKIPFQAVAAFAQRGEEVRGEESEP